MSSSNYDLQAWLDWADVAPSTAYHAHRIVHFVGVTPAQHANAVKIWGKPAFTHPRATWSCMGEISGDDVVVLGAAAFSHTRRAPSAHSQPARKGR